MNIITTVTGAWETFATKIAAFLPDLVAAVIILTLGWIGCNVIKRVSVRVLKLCYFDTFADRSGVSAALKRGGIRQLPSEILGLLIFWFLFLIVVVAGLDTLGLPGVKETLGAIFLYIPKIMAAIVVLILGLYLANFVETVARTTCANAGLTQAQAIGRTAYYCTTIFIIAGILEILNIASEIVTWAFILIFGAVCFALALAFGLGGRDVAGRFLEKWLEQKDK